MTFDYKKEFFRYRHYYQRIEPVFQKPETVAYTMIILSIATMSFFGFFAIRPTVTTIASLNREIEDSAFVNEQFDEKITVLIAAQEEYQSIQRDLPIIYESMPETSNFPSLMMQIESLAREYNASLSALQFQRIPISPVSNKEATSSAASIQLQEPEPFVFTISLKADYTRVMQFLDNLMSVSRLIIIKQLEITGSQNKTELNLNLLLNSFYLP